MAPNREQVEPQREQVDPERWLAALTRSLSDAPADVDGSERALVLDLARIAAHTSERWAAPIAAYLAGASLGALPSSQRRDALAALVARLDADHPEQPAPSEHPERADPDGARDRASGPRDQPDDG